jgi:hypothetical protein
MRIQDIFDSYSQASAKLGEQARALSLSGIAAIWVFNTQGTAGLTLPRDLLLPGVVFVLSLALDLFQLAYGVFAWGIVARVQERRGFSHGEDILLPVWISWPSHLMFYGKFVAVVIGYTLLLRALSLRFLG